MQTQIMDNRQARYKAVYKWALVVYLAACAALLIFHLTRRDWYQAAQSVLSMALCAIMPLLYRVTPLRRVYQIDLMVLIFAFIAHTLGTAAEFYHIFHGYDKVMHTLSGALTMMLALPMFYLLKRPHVVEERDCALAIAFCLAVTLSVGGLWEIAEFWINFFTGIDVQVVAETGVADTMYDMMVCLIGGIAVVPSMAAFYRKGREGFIMRALTSFVAQNFHQSEEVNAQ